MTAPSATKVNTAQYGRSTHAGLPGTYQDELGSLDCKTCPAGKYSHGEEFWECLEASPGYWAPSNSGNQTACLKGEYSALPGATKCDECVAGKHSDKLAATACDDCVAGKYADNIGTIDCSTTDPGSSSGKGATAPTPAL